LSTARTFGDGRGLGVGPAGADRVDVADAVIDAVLEARGAFVNTVPFVDVGNGDDERVELDDALDERVGNNERVGVESDELVLVEKADVVAVAEAVAVSLCCANAMRGAANSSRKAGKGDMVAPPRHPKASHGAHDIVVPTTYLVTCESRVTPV
jgi:hypothetical protein